MSTLSNWALSSEEVNDLIRTHAAFAAVEVVRLDAPGDYILPWKLPLGYENATNETIWLHFTEGPHSTAGDALMLPPGCVLKAVE